MTQNLPGLELLPLADDQAVEVGVGRDPLGVVLDQHQIAELFQLIGRKTTPGSEVVTCSPCGQRY